LKACAQSCNTLLNPKEPKAKNKHVASLKAKIEAVKKVAVEKAQGVRRVAGKWEAELKVNGQKRMVGQVRNDLLGRRVEEVVGRDFVDGCVREMVESAVDALQGVARVKVE